MASSTERPAVDGSRTYPVRQLVAYGRLIVKGERIDPERVVADYARANPDVDLEARTTIGEWQAGKRPGDTAIRVPGLPVR
jgi:hypothetical protein